jgi:hypothetical protein
VESSGSLSPSQEQSLSLSRSVQSTSPHPTLPRWLPTHLHLDLPTDIFPSGFPTNNIHVPILYPFVLHFPISSYSTWSLWRRVHMTKLLVMSFVQPPAISPHFRSKILLATLFSKTLSLYSSLHIRAQVSRTYKKIQNYSLVCFKFYVLGQQKRRQNVLEWMVGSLPELNHP